MAGDLYVILPLANLQREAEHTIVSVWLIETEIESLYTQTIF